MDTKKYIIEIPDNTAWIQWVKVSDKDGHVCFDFKDPEDLTPYTEPGLEQVRKEAYEKGYEAGTYDAKELFKGDASKAYQKGLSDAWDAARKITRLTVAERVRLFNGITTEGIFISFSAQSIIYKIRQYEQEQEEIKVGDEVQHRDHSGIGVIVLEKDDDAITAIAVTNVPFCCKVGDMYINRDVKDWKKTGKHYEIAEVLKKIHEEKE